MAQPSFCCQALLVQPSFCVRCSWRSRHSAVGRSWRGCRHETPAPGPTFEWVFVDHDDLGQEHVVVIIVELLLIGCGCQVTNGEPDGTRDDEQGQPVAGTGCKDPEGGQGKGQDEPNAESRNQESNTSQPAILGQCVTGHRQQGQAERRRREDEHGQAKETVDRVQ